MAEHDGYDKEPKGLKEGKELEHKGGRKVAGRKGARKSSRK